MTTPPELALEEAMRLRALRALDLVETPLDERFERITRLARRLLGVDFSAISLVEADRQFFKSIQGLDVCETSRDVSFCGHAILADGPFIVPDARRDERFTTNPLVTGPPHIVSYASQPLRSTGGFNVGTLCVIHTEPREFDGDDVRSLQDLAAFAELALQAATANAVQAALIEEVSVEQRRALIDPLTRMWNREGILRLLRAMVEGTQASDVGAAAVVIDLDEFKRINDAHGHPAGDEVLRVATRRMLSALRETDAVGRIGGDEFLCVLSPCATPEAAGEVAERVRRRLTAQPVKTDEGDISLGASIGVCFVSPGFGGTPEDLIALADTAMYDCKRNGRNGVRVACAKRAAA